MKSLAKGALKSIAQARERNGSRKTNFSRKSAFLNNGSPLKAAAEASNRINAK